VLDKENKVNKNGSKAVGVGRGACDKRREIRKRKLGASGEVGTSRLKMEQPTKKRRSHHCKVTIMSSLFLNISCSHFPNVL
jgi:hypothetical protein